VHPHESPKVMTVPLIVLAALSVLGGLLLVNDWIVDYLSPVVGTAEHETLPMPAIVISLLVVLTVAAGVGTAWFLYTRRDVPRVAPVEVPFWVTAARKDVYGDVINDGLVVRPTTRLIAGLTTFDTAVVDGLVEGSTLATGGLALRARRLQNGFVRSYALSLFGGAILVVLALLAVNLA